MAFSSLNRKPHNHARSNSLPSKPHPVILQCNEHLARLGASDTTSSSSSLLINCKLSDLQDLHDCVEKLVQLPLTHEALVREHEEKSVSDLLDGSLRVLDVCTSAKDALLHTKECTRELQSILRRRRGNDVEFASEVKKCLSLRKVVRKAIFKALENNVKFFVTNKCSTKEDYQTMVLVSLLRDSQEVTLSIFESLLKFISGSTAQSKSGSWSFVSKLMQNKKVALDENEFAKVDAALQFFVFNLTSKINININDLQNKLEKLESCIQDLEEGLESLFRHLIRIRVSLLNILNH